jgi:hypothetical protein
MRLKSWQRIDQAYRDEVEAVGDAAVVHFEQEGPLRLHGLLTDLDDRVRELARASERADAILYAPVLREIAVLALRGSAELRPIRIARKRSEG